jgi:hypothetical protein
VSESSGGVDNGDLDLDPPDPATLHRISGQLKVLIPEARRWRHNRWLTWLALGTAVLGAALTVFTVSLYLHQRGDEDDEDRRFAELTEQAFRAECEVSARNARERNQGLAVAFTDFAEALGVELGATPAQRAAFLASFLPDLETHLAESVPVRDCDAEAARRAAEG